MASNDNTSASMQADGGQQQQAANAATSPVIAVLPTGPVTGQQAVDVTEAHHQEITDLRLQNQQLQQQQQQMQQQLQQLLQQQQSAPPANIAAAQQHPAAALAQPALRTKELKLPDPKEYRGSRDRMPIRDWLRDVEELFAMANVSTAVASTITYAAHYLRDDAKTWYKLQESSVHTWNDFRELLIQRYRDPREVEKARQRLAAVRQIGSVEQYTIAFDRATMELADVTSATPNNEELIFMYHEGLKPQIRTALAARDTITNLKQMQTVALQIDAALYSSRGSSMPVNMQSNRPQQHQSRNNGNRFNNNRSNSSFNQRSNNYGRRDFSRYPPRYPPSFGSSSSSHNSQSDSRGYAPMDTSNVIREQKRSSAPHAGNHTNDRKQSSNVCYNCGKSGHFARECRSSKSYTSQQRNNVIIQEESSATDDTVLIIQELNSAVTSKSSKRLITFTGMVDDHPAYVLIDSGATTNYLSESFVKQHGIYTEPIADTTHAVIADGTALSVTQAAPNLAVRIQEYADTISANVMALDRYDLILSMAWLDSYCPSVDYRAKTVTFEHDGKVITLKPPPADTDVHTTAHITESNNG